MKEDFTKETGIGSTYEPELVNKLNRYCNLSGENRVKFVSDLIEKELSNKILDNNFIELEEPFYFMMECEFKLGTKINPVKDFYELNLYDEEYLEDFTDAVFLVKRIPNNLDVWSKEYNTYCYNNNPDLHKGVYIYIDVSITNESVERIPIIFNYNSSTNVLELETVPSFLSLKNKLNLDVTYHDFFTDLEHDSKRIASDVLTFDYENLMLIDVNFKLYYETYKVISHYVSENKLKEQLYIDYDYKGSDVIEFCISNCLNYELR